VVCRQGKGCDDGGVMVVTAAVRHHDGSGAEGDGESGGVHWSPPDSTGLHRTQVDCQPSGVRWTGQLDWTPLDSTGLQSSCFEWFSNGFGWPLSPVESGGVRQSLPESNRIMWGRDKNSSSGPISSV